jgi:non-specific serine/threonine protein kinase
VVLFARRAGEVRPKFAITADNAQAVAQVCRLSEGLPIFLELAAAQLRSLSVEQLAEQLTERFHVLNHRSLAVEARHQSLRAAIEWSFTLCSEAERLAWVRASVFAGRFDLDAAEAVCADEQLPVGEVLHGLAGLIDKSVLVSAERDERRRYWMLDILCLYGLERLRGPPGSGERAATAELQLRRRHRDYFLAMARQFNADWFGPRQVQWSRRMRAELPEVRAALEFCLATPGEAPAALRLAGQLNFFWWACGATREGRLWLDRALAANPTPTKNRARALAVYVRVLVSAGLYVEGGQPARECLELARRFDDPALLVDALCGRGLNLLQSGQPAAALPLLDEAIECAASIPDTPVALALATLYRASAALSDGDARRADALTAQCRAVCRAHGDQWRLNHALGLSMRAALMLGDVERATAYGRESLSYSAALGDTVGLTMHLEVLAWTAAAAGDHRQAARLFGAADQRARVNGGNPFHTGVFGHAHDQHEAKARAKLGDARFDAEFRAGAELSVEDAIAYGRGHGPPPGPPRSRAAPPAGDELPQLTNRELEVALLIAEGLTNKQIAHKLVIAHRTAESHVEHILIKLGFTTRTQIASWVLAERGAGGPGGDDDHPSTADANRDL